MRKVATFVFWHTQWRTNNALKIAPLLKLQQKKHRQKLLGKYNIKKQQDLNSLRLYAVALPLQIAVRSHKRTVDSLVVRDR